MAYFSIPFTLLYFVRRRKDLRFTWVFVCFAIFIVACGASHFMEIWTVWHPAYWLSGGVKAVTAAASVPTAILLVKMVPVALRVPSPSALEAANNELALEVTERRRTEEELRKLNDLLEARVAERTAQLSAANAGLLTQIRERKKSEALLALTLASIQDGVMVTDDNGTITFMNDAASRLAGRDAVDAVNCPVWSVFNIIDPISRDRASLMAANQASISPEKILITAEGHEVPIDVRVAPLQADPVDARGMVYTLRDYSERKRAEEQLRSLNLELEARVLARTTELQERDVMIQEIHHRVKNNLQVISSLINMQVRTIRDDATRTALRQCQSRVETMAQIHEMLYQSKDYGQIPFSRYVRELATRVFAASEIARTDVRIEYEMSDLFMTLDKAIPCGLILNELISNALKHAFPHGTGTVRIALQRISDRRISLTVSDDGIGLAEDFDSGQSRSLGIRLVKTLTQQLGGQLEIFHQRGTTFRIYLDVVPAA